jgi:hypothetical protein
LQAVQVAGPGRAYFSRMIPTNSPDTLPQPSQRQFYGLRKNSVAAYSKSRRPGLRVGSLDRNPNTNKLIKNATTM